MAGGGILPIAIEFPCASRNVELATRTGAEQ